MRNYLKKGTCLPILESGHIILCYDEWQSPLGENTDGPSLLFGGKGSVVEPLPYDGLSFMRCPDKRKLLKGGGGGRRTFSTLGRKSDNIGFQPFNFLRERLDGV